MLRPGQQAADAGHGDSVVVLGRAAQAQGINLVQDRFVKPHGKKTPFAPPVSPGKSLLSYRILAGFTSPKGGSRLFQQGSGLRPCHPVWGQNPMAGKRSVPPAENRKGYVGACPPRSHIAFSYSLARRRQIADTTGSAHGPEAAGNRSSRFSCRPGAHHSPARRCAP